MLTCSIKQDQFFEQAPVPIYTSAFSPFGDGASGYDHLYSSSSSTPVREINSRAIPPLATLGHPLEKESSLRQAGAASLRLVRQRIKSSPKPKAAWVLFNFSNQQVVYSTNRFYLSLSSLYIRFTSFTFCCRKGQCLVTNVGAFGKLAQAGD